MKDDDGWMLAVPCSFDLPRGRGGEGGFIRLGVFFWRKF